MSKKNSSVILKTRFKDYKELYDIYSLFKKRINASRKKSFLIAISGGPDSLALAALTKAYSHENKCKFFYVLIDHNLRKNSSKEAQSVKKLLKKFKINLHILKNKKSIRRNIQGQAREIRYNLLTNFCRDKKIKIMLTAHNLEDQVETFFIRLSRGSGLQGLSSMKQSNKISNNVTLLRPLLSFKKEKLIKISKLIFGKFYKDPSNNDTKYLRTRIRNLKQIIEKSGVSYDQIFKSINNLSSSRDTLDLYFKKIYSETVNLNKKKLSVNLKKFNSLNQELKIRIFSQAIKDLTKAYYSPRAKKIINLINQLKTSKDKKLTLGGCLILKEKNHVFLTKHTKN